jgi:phosphoglycolate phosphatase
MSVTPDTASQPAPPNLPRHSLSNLRVLAADYDGTIAEHGRMSADTEAALRSLRGIGFRLILVSGRRLENIRQICGVLELFDAVILENGAVTFCPTTGIEQLIAPPLDERFLDELKQELSDEPLFVGRSMAAAGTNNVARVEMVIARGGYHLDIIACGSRVLVLPAGINKGSGLSFALANLGLRRDQVVAVGDEENDIELLSGCALKVAVGNAVPKLKETADLVLPGLSGQSVQCLVDMLIAGAA